jgi:hypothetical protein
MSRKIVWISRHVPTNSQLVELERLFPGCHLHIDARSFSNAQEIMGRFREVRGDEMVVVAPWTVMRELIRLGAHPLYAEMKEVPCDSSEVEVRIPSKRRRCYKFIRFLWCEGVKLDLREVTPQTRSQNGIAKPTVLLNTAGETVALVKG